MLGAAQEAQLSKVVVVNKSSVNDALLVSKLQDESFRVTYAENTSWDILLPKQAITFIFHRGSPDDQIRGLSSELIEQGYHPVILVKIELSTANISADFLSMYPAQVMMYMDVYDIIAAIENFFYVDPNPFQAISLEEIQDAPVTLPISVFTTNLKLTIERAKYLTWTEESFDEQDLSLLVSMYRTVGGLMQATDEEIIDAAPKIGQMIVDFLSQDYHVE